MKICPQTSGPPSAPACPVTHPPEEGGRLVRAHGRGPPGNDGLVTLTEETGQAADMAGDSPGEVDQVGEDPEEMVEATLGAEDPQAMLTMTKKLT